MKTVLIIGGGPGGLTTLKTLLHFPNREFDPVVLEAAPRVGGTFSQRSYENGNLVSSKQLTSFSDCEPTRVEQAICSRARADPRDAQTASRWTRRTT